MKTQVLNFALESYLTFFDGGKGLSGTFLKNYTSGDKDCKGFEGLQKDIVLFALKKYGLDSRLQLKDGNFYLQDPGEVFDPQHLDLHLVDDKEHGDRIVYIEEARTWLDKPFFIQKTGVIHNIMTIEAFKNQLSDRCRCKFIFTCLAVNLTDKTIKTQQATCNGANKIEMFNFTEAKRSKKENYNWFSVPPKPLVIKRYIDNLCDMLEHLDE